MQSVFALPSMDGRTINPTYAVNMQSTVFALPSVINPTSKELSNRPSAAGNAKEESEPHSDGSNRGFALKMVACLAVVILAVQVRAIDLFMLASSISELPAA